jgi:hypothetical protein
MKRLLLVGIFLCVALSAAWAQTRPLTDQELDALTWPSTSIASVKALVERNVIDAATLAKEIEKEFGIDVMVLPLGALFSKVHDVIEVGDWCYHGRTGQSVSQKVGQLNTLHDNVIKLEHVLWQKDTSTNHMDYWRFFNTPQMRAFHQLDLKRPSASSRPKACPLPRGPTAKGAQNPAEACAALAPSRGINPFGGYDPEPIIQQRTRAYQDCLRRANGLPPFGQTICNNFPNSPGAYCQTIPHGTNQTGPMSSYNYNVRQ